MYLHIGNRCNIRTRDIIGIFDTDNATVSAVTRRFLSDAEKRGGTDAASEEIPKSFVVYRQRGKVRIYFSQLSSAALRGRCEQEEQREMLPRRVPGNRKREK